jgi:hypothetical protein
MFRSHGTARQLCLGVLLVVVAALCVPAPQASAATPSRSPLVVDTAR